MDTRSAIAVAMLSCGSGGLLVNVTAAVLRRKRSVGPNADPDRTPVTERRAARTILWALFGSAILTTAGALLAGYPTI